MNLSQWVHCSLVQAAQPCGNNNYVPVISLSEQVHCSLVQASAQPCANNISVLITWTDEQDKTYLTCNILTCFRPSVILQLMMRPLLITSERNTVKECLTFPFAMVWIPIKSQHSCFHLSLNCQSTFWMDLLASSISVMLLTHGSLLGSVFKSSYKSVLLKYCC